MRLYTLFRPFPSGLERGVYIQTTRPLSEAELRPLRWIVAETFEPDQTSCQPLLPDEYVVEIGPGLNIETPESEIAVSICSFIPGITRIEQTYRHPIGQPGAPQTREMILAKHLDRMTQQELPGGIKTFDMGILPEPVRTIDLLERGIVALQEINKELGLGMDAYDIEYYRELFVEKLGRNPTDVELFQVANANSEHCRHWFFRGLITIDGEPMSRTLLEIVQEPLKRLGNENRSLKAFNDNAGVLRGFPVCLLLPAHPGKPSEMELHTRLSHLTGTAETHNHPTFVAPFPGAQTGAGGRIRDTCAVGRAGIIGIGVAGYAVGNLFLPGYEIPGEVEGREKPSQYASPLQILIDGSNGVSSYGNQIGEPLTLGFARTFGQRVDREWREYRKPILYSGGVGHLFDDQVQKEAGEVGMLIVRISGPAYPIGVGGGSASSMTQGQNTQSLDLHSVQRGNAEMENKVNRVIRTGAELGPDNPIASIHDQGAGGPSNVLTELLEPLGGTIDIRKITLGDKTMSVLTIWSAEFQEAYGLLVRPERLEVFQAICKRERVDCQVVGMIDGNGKVVVKDSQDDTTPVDLNLEQILTNLPQKTFPSERRKRTLSPLDLPKGLSIADALKAVFTLPSVGSKGYLVHKVDRSVTGLVAQQQCCGIEQIAISNISINAQSHFDFTGTAAAIGEQPMKMLINSAAGARMTMGELMTNMVCALISDIGDIRYRENWMNPAKLPHEGVELWDAACAASELAIELGIAADGGKDSLSMAAKIGEETVKAPGTLVLLGYAPMPNVTQKVTPDIKRPGNSRLAVIDLGKGKNRLGGSALAQAHNQLGNESPDVDDPMLLRNAFQCIQELIRRGLVLSVHDRSDGGLLTTVAEMCMASRCGFSLRLPWDVDPISMLFNEELGFVLELDPRLVEQAYLVCAEHHVPITDLGSTEETTGCMIVTDRAKILFEESIVDLRGWWEATSARLEAEQGNPVCARQEYAEHRRELPEILQPPSYRLTFVPTETPSVILTRTDKPRVAVLREEGTNGDREMAAAWHAAGFAVTDLCMNDLLLDETLDLDSYQGLAFAGGFSYMDVFDSAKGWAAGILFNPRLKQMFERFYERKDTFSLGVCNGCQLMALLGWVPWQWIKGTQQPRFVHNTSGKFESRWAQVEILPSPSILLKGMEGSKLGVWVAHGEGRLLFPSSAVAERVKSENLAPLAYVDPFGNRTETYPYNPNGSPLGITALCSPDGRHLAMMPHPERCFLSYQQPWKPRLPRWNHPTVGPWLHLFQNAYTWCMEQRT